MAYGVKYRFQLESYNGVTYRVDLLEDGYSGDITTRPLGKAPVLRMQEADPFRSTSCDLVLECQSDGEYVDLYTTDPFHFKVEVQSVDGNGVWNLWNGYVPTEIYSEPDIAPPYDVRITATDGIGLLKEYTFDAVGAKSIRAHICDILEKTGDEAPMFYYATRLCKLGSTEVAFMDEALIDLDYMAGESCYDVLKHILVSLRSVLIYRGTHWLIVREVDVQMSADGMLTAVQCITSDPYYTPTSTTVKEGMAVGQMGVADMWPVGYLTRRVAPAKKSVQVKAPWHYVNGYPEVSANGWTVVNNTTFDSTNKLYHIGTRTQSVATGKGSVRYSKTLFRFVDNFKVNIKANAHSVYGQDVEIGHYVRVDVSWAPLSGGSTYYWSSKYGWNDDSDSEGEEISVEETNESHDPNACKIVEVLFPPVPDNNPGVLTVKVNGALVDVYDIEVLPATVAGYEDRILIDNGARGEAETIDIFGGRLMLSNFINLDFYQGIFFHTDGQASGPDTQFSDLMNIGKDFMSLTALAYAREVAAPRIEISGKLNNKYVPTIGMPVPFIKCHGVWAFMKSYDWDMMTEDVSFTAVTLPSVVLDVEDEVITSIAPEGGISGGSSSGSGGGGGGGGGTGTVTSVGMTVPAGMTISGSPITGSGTLALGLGEGKAIPDASDVSKGVTAYGWGNHANAGYADADDVEDALALKQDEISDISTIRNNASKGATAYGWGDHSQAGYADADDVEDALDDKQDKINDLDTIRSNAAHGETAYGWGDHAQEGYVKSSDLSDYLPKTGGELTGDLWLHTSSSNFGSKLWFGDKGSGAGYVYLHEDSDDHLKIYADRGLELSTGSGYDVTVNGIALTPPDYVTKSGEQTITGEKTFTTKPVHIGSTSGIDVNGSSYIDLGDARLKWDANNHSLYVTKRPGSSYAGDINLIVDGDVGAGGVGTGAAVKYVNCANQSAYDSISPKDPGTIYTVGTAPSFSRIYLGSIKIYGN